MLGKLNLEIHVARMIALYWDNAEEGAAENHQTEKERARLEKYRTHKEL